MHKDADRESWARERSFVESIARQLVLDPNAADDIVQETLLAAMRNPPDRSRRGWLARVVRNLAYRSLRADERRRRREHAVARDDTAPDTAEAVARVAWLRRVSDTLLQLDEPHRTVLVLRYFDDLSSREIGARLGVPAATVRTRLRRGLERMRERLDASHGDRRAWCLALLPVAFAPRPPGASPAATGVAIVSAKKNLVLAATLLLALCATLWLGLRGRRSEPREERADAGREAASKDVVRVPPAGGRILVDRFPLHAAGFPVRVENEGGEPVPDALVRWSGGESAGNATSDERGLLRIEDAHPEELHVFARGYRSARVNVAPADPEAVVRVGRGASIAGRVVSTRGHGVAGARVWAHGALNLVAWPNDLDRLPDRAVAGNWTRTDDDGWFRIDGLAEGEFILRARVAGFAQMDWGEPKSYPSGRDAVVITMAPTSLIEICIRDAVTREPIREAQASVVGGLKRGLVTTGGETASLDAPFGQNDAGVSRFGFAIPDDVTPEITVWGTAPGYRRASAAATVREAVTRVTLALEPERSAPRGRLSLAARFEQSDAPFTGWLELWLREGGAHGRVIVQFQNGESVEPVSLRPGQYGCFVRGAGDVGSFWGSVCDKHTFEIHEDGDTRLELTVRGTQIDLRVLDPEGRPLRGYDLVVHTATGPRGGARRWDVPTNSTESFRWRAEYDGPDLVVPPGVTKIRVAIPHFGRSEVIEFEAGARGERISVDLRVKPVE